jgi:hypothetical protein
MLRTRAACLAGLNVFGVSLVGMVHYHDCATICVFITLQILPWKVEKILLCGDEIEP